MEKISIGEYIRTRDGNIDKVVEVSQNYILANSKILIAEYGQSHTFINIKKNEIVKHSKDIIDLIEERRFCK